MSAIDRHGGEIHRAARTQACNISELLDFSASINPLGPPVGVLRALQKGLQAIRHYPDREAHELRLALSRSTGLPPDWLLPGNGSSELIRLLPVGLGITHALILGPTFSEYATALRQAQARWTYCLAERTHRYQPPLACALAQVQADPTIDALFLCNPNSPTGAAITKSALRGFLNQLFQRSCWAVVDEAFVEFAADVSMVEWLPAYPRLVVLRSCTKFFAIPGLRLGYLAAHPSVVERIQRQQAPWSVNTLAQIAGAAALEDVGYQLMSLAYIEKERLHLASLLTGLSGLQVFPSAANFLLLELPPPISASRLAAHLLGRGILIRDCSHVPGLNAQTVRVAVRARCDNDRLCRMLADVLHA